MGTYTACCGTLPSQVAHGTHALWGMRALTVACGLCRECHSCSAAAALHSAHAIAEQAGSLIQKYQCSLLSLTPIC